MLLPKRVKHRRQFRGSMAGKATRGNKITNGEFGIVATEPCWIKSNQIEATQHSKLPLPLPIRTPIGLPVTGLSGKIFINTLPPRLMYLVIATRAASIWFDLIQHGSVATIPYSPLVILLPLVALPAIEPRNCLRCSYG